MNKKQINCLWIGIAVIVLMGLFPPVSKRGRILVDGYGKTYGNPTTSVKYEFILNTSAQVVMSNLIAQWVIVSAITGGLVVTFADKKVKKPKDEEKQ